MIIISYYLSRIADTLKETSERRQDEQEDLNDQQG